MTFFKSDPPKKYLPQNSVLFSMDSSAGDVFLLLPFLFFGRKNPLSPIFEALFSYAASSPVFPSNLCILSCRKRWYLFIFRPIAYSINSLYTFSVER